MKANIVDIKTKVQRWAERITAAYGDSVQAIIEVGRQLQQAKAECSRGEWGELTGQTTGKPLLPFSHQTAHRLKSIAVNPALSNAAHARHLPASWYTLAILAAIDADDIESAIADGTIHPEMERKDAEALARQIKGDKRPPLDFGPVAVGRMADPPPLAPEPEPTQEQQIKLAAVREELCNKLRQLGEIQEGADQRRAENAWHDRNDPHTRGLARGVELVVGLKELVRLATDAEVRPVLTKDQTDRALEDVNRLGYLIQEGF